MSKITTRFAPSPTGYLHIGGARTALFNYLFARSLGGKFLLRIEDTDIERSKQEYLDSIIKSLRWLSMEWDGDIVFQSKRAARHVEVAHELVKLGKAYKCYLKPEEVAEFKSKNAKFRSPWRDKFSESDMPFVIRLRSDSDIIVNDKIQGEVKFSVQELDDQVLVRSNGLPTYMLSVVVDDHDMGITDIIRGDDHLVNTPKQILIYKALGWDIPNFYHIPLIHGVDGSKLSKREGANMIDYEEKYLPQAVRNYFLNLGWHSPLMTDTSTLEEIIKIFDAKGLRKSPSRIDFKKLEDINSRNLKLIKEDEIFNILKSVNLSEVNMKNIKLGLKSILDRAKYLKDLDDLAKIYTEEFFPDIDPNEIDAHMIKSFVEEFKSIKFSENEDNKKVVEDFCKNFSIVKNLDFKNLMSNLRLALTGSKTAPSLFEMISIIGKDLTIARLNRIL